MHDAGMLLECDRLDPRPVDETRDAPYDDCVNVPLCELAARVHELPPRRLPLQVVGGGAAAEAALRWLADNGRCARRAPTPPVPQPRDAPGDASGIRRRLWRPNPFLEQTAGARSEPGPVAGRTVLELACGSGRDAVFLASLGCRVIAVDHLPDALARAADLEQRYRVGQQPIRWVRADVAAHELPVDGLFDLIVGIRYLNRALLPRLQGWLRPGGWLIWETFTTLHRERHGRPTSDAHVLHTGELPSLLSQLHIRAYAEDWRDDAHVAQILAERPLA